MIVLLVYFALICYVLVGTGLLIKMSNSNSRRYRTKINRDKDDI